MIETNNPKKETDLEKIKLMMMIFDLVANSNKNKLPSINRNSEYGKELTNQRNSAQKNP